MRPSDWARSAAGLGQTLRAGAHGVALLAVGASIAGSATAGDRPGAVEPYDPFVDTRLTWTFGDDDFRHQTGEALPLSADASVGDRPQYRLFFDGLNSRFSGRENLTQLALYRKLPGFWPRVETEAALALRVDMSQLATQSNDLDAVLQDAGSYLRVSWRAAGRADAQPPQGFSATLFPIDTDRFRLGWLYDLSWGGTNARLNQSIFPRLQAHAPGAKFEYDGDGWYVYGGFKTASIVEVERRIPAGAGQGAPSDTARIAQTNYGFLAGAGVDASEGLRFDAGAGYFQQGRFEQPDVIGQRVFTFGVSGRALAHGGGAIPGSVDFLLYRNDPGAPARMLTIDTYAPGRTSWALSAEATRLLQNVKNFDATGTTTLQPATAAAVRLDVKSGFLRATLCALYRDLAYVLRNQPSFIPFESLPKAARSQAEAFVAASVDYFVEGPRLTPGLGVGVQLPATFRSDSQDLLGQSTSRTIVVREQGNLAVLPVGEGRVPILQGRASLKWDLSNLLSAIGWVQWIHDENATRLELDPSGAALLRQFVRPDFIGFGMSAQARF